MEQKLRDYHAIGTRLAALTKPDISRLASEYRVTPHLLRRMRTFGRLFSTSELGALCSLRRPNGLPLQWGHVNYLLIVKNKKARTVLQKQAAREGWTAPLLNSAIPSEHRGKAPQGRKMSRPKSAAAGLRQLVIEGEAWLRRMQVIMDGLGESGGDGPDPLLRGRSRRGHDAHEQHAEATARCEDALGEFTAVSLTFRDATDNSSQSRRQRCASPASRCCPSGVGYFTSNVRFPTRDERRGRPESPAERWGRPL